VRRALFEQAFVVARRHPLAPAPIRVVARLLRQHRQVVVQLDNHVGHALIVVTHPGSLMAESDKSWCPPTSGDEYPGPPAAPAADPAWRPSQHNPIPAPRQLPELDNAAIDEAERRAARLTYAVGLAALAIVLVMWIGRIF